MADIKYKSFPFSQDQKKRSKLEISGDYDKYEKVMKNIGARRNNSLNVWFLDNDLEYRLKNAIQKLGGDPDKQKIIEKDEKQITMVEPKSNAISSRSTVVETISNVSNLINIDSSKNIKQENDKKDEKEASDKSESDNQNDNESDESKSVSEKESEQENESESEQESENERESESENESERDNESERENESENESDSSDSKSSNSNSDRHYKEKTPERVTYYKKEVINTDQTYKGSLCIVIPGARILKIVVIKLIEPKIEAAPDK